MPLALLTVVQDMNELGPAQKKKKKKKKKRREGKKEERGKVQRMVSKLKAEQFSVIVPIHHLGHNFDL